ncbi:hypothetical protein M9Y10_021102 [Tritrichomonas musculus]|uniref:TPR Domain containing protein n=1 Tax=Tritrichomonas musculus TaxID=1915356 RepID=A0ABR2HD09_9EUKA
MSHLPSSQMQRQRNARKPVVTSPRQAHPPKRLKQRELDSSCHRLSRVPQKFANNKAIQNEKSESFAVNYFKKNPDARDSTPPDQKLQEIEDKLKSEDIDTSERFTLLVRQKALRYILYGENSAEALRSHAAIGIFYNQNHRSASAIRHLTKAHQLEDQNDIEPEESLEIAVETAEAYINIQSEKTGSKNFNNAEKVLMPWQDEEVENPMLKYRRDLSLARILFNKGQVDDCIKKYEEAWQSLDQANGGEEKVETAVLFYELARVYDFVEKKKKAGEYFTKSYNIYKKLDMEDEANEIEPYLPTGDEVDQEDEDQNDEEDTEERQVESRSSSQNPQNTSTSAKSDNEDDKNSQHSEHSGHSEHSDKDAESEHHSEHSDDEKKNSEEEDKERSSSNHSSRNSNRDDSEKDKSQSEDAGRAEQLLGGFGNALLGNKESNEDEKSEKDDDDEDDDEGNSSEKDKMNSTSGFDNSESNNDKSETDKSNTGGFDDSEQKTSSEKPKLSDTGGFDESENNTGDDDE